MEKNNGKVLAVAALVVAVVALSVGFAAYSAQLTISSASATMQATDEFSGKVNYLASSAKCYKTGDPDKANVAVGTGYAVGTASGKTWTGISVPLTKENGYSVTCEATIENASAYIAYLKGIAADKGLECASVATEGSDVATNSNTICANTTLTVQVGTGDDNKLVITNASDSKNNTNGTIAAKSGDNGSTTVTLVITNTGAVAADGDVKITIPTITLDYSTAQ